MANLNKAAITTKIGQLLADNTNGDISAADARQIATDLKDSNFNLNDNTTTDVPEGTNLYFTTSRTDARIITEAQAGNTDRWPLSKLPANLVTTPDIAGIATNTSAITALQLLVNTNSSGITANSNSITTINTTLATLRTDINSNDTDISNLQSGKENSLTTARVLSFFDSNGNVDPSISTADNTKISLNAANQVTAAAIEALVDDANSNVDVVVNNNLLRINAPTATGGFICNK